MFASPYQGGIDMRKGIRKQVAVLAFSLAAVTGICLGQAGTNTMDQAKAGTKVEVKAKKKAKTRKPCTKTNHCSVKKGKSLWVGPSYAGVHPQTTKWKSSNSSIATVSTKGDSEGGHKVTAKKKGKVTISCTVSKTGGPWVKGDVYKWIITVK